MPIFNTSTVKAQTRNSGQYSRTVPAKEYKALKKDDMHVTGKLFGVRFVEGPEKPGLVELYVEDDELYHFKCCFHPHWLPDLEKVTRDMLLKMGKLTLPTA